MFLGLNQGTGEMTFTSNFYNSDPQFHSFLVVPQAWTLGIEATFYLIAPLIVRKSNAFIAALIVISLSIRAFTYLHLGYTNDPWTYRFFPSELALFLIGTLSYRLYDSWLNTRMFTKRFQYPIALTFFGTIVFYQFIPFNEGYYTHLINWFLYALTCLALPFIFALTKSS